MEQLIAPLLAALIGVGTFVVTQRRVREDETRSATKSPVELLRIQNRLLTDEMGALTVRVNALELRRQKLVQELKFSEAERERLGAELASAKQMIERLHGGEEHEHRG